MSLKFVQVHNFYSKYLTDFYRINHSLSTVSFKDQIDVLIKDGLGAVHIFAPYMNELGYDAQFIVANNPYAQKQWARENNISLANDENWMYEITRQQVNQLQPDILYLSDPGRFESQFIRSLSWKPSLIIGWRASDIPENTDWSEFDIMLSSLSALREVALKLGAKSTEHFFPGYPIFINDRIRDVKPSFDVVFSGQWTLKQHPRRNQYLNKIAKIASQQGNEFSCAFYLCRAASNHIPLEVKEYDLGARFGIEMHRALCSGKIAIDARGILKTNVFSNGKAIDIARNETANMRIFETTGSGVFLLTEHYDNLQQYFDIGKEIETFHNEADLIEKIHYYLKNPDKREVIAKRGQKRCLKEYAMEKRAQHFNKIIHTYLSKKQ